MQIFKITQELSAWVSHDLVCENDGHIELLKRHSHLLPKVTTEIIMLLAHLLKLAHHSLGNQRSIAHEANFARSK